MNKTEAQRSLNGFIHPSSFILHPLTTVRTFHSHEIKEESQVGAARRAAHRFAAGLGFTEDELAELDIVVQEIGTNAVKYSGGGGLLHWTTALGDEAGLELFYWDKGPGIYDLERAVSDGVSSGGSLGTGFGAIRRLTDEFDVYSRTRGTTSRLSQTRRTTHGTALLCRKHVRARRAAAEGWRGAPLRSRLGVWSRCRKGEDVNGDAYFVGRHGEALLLAAVDGLGHGRGAQQASLAAVESLAEWRGEPLGDVILGLHDALRATRGAVAGAVVINPGAGTFHYAGVGNVEVRVFNSPEPIRPISANGTLGARLGRLRVWQFPWAEGATIVLASDGLSASWDVGDYPGLLQKTPQLMAGVLMRDYSRDSDDATVLVARL